MISKKYRFILFLLSISLLFAIGLFIENNPFILVSNFWFSSGLLLLILLSLIDQPHFSKDADIFVNSITASISLLLVKKQDYDWLFWLFFGIVIYLVVSSYILMWLRNNPLNEENKIIQFVSRLNRQLGKPETLFSAFFLWGAVKQFSLVSGQFNLLLWFWIVFMLLNIPNIAISIEKIFSTVKTSLNPFIIGQIFGVQSKNTFLVKLLPFKSRKPIKMFDFVDFSYSIDNKNRKGIVFDVYFLNQEQWIKVISNDEIDDIFTQHEPISYLPDAVYKIENVPENDYLKRFVGIITENSQISRIRFLYNSRKDIYEGQLLEVKVNNQTVLYQIVEGLTKIEQLENKNQNGLIIGEAIQLGTWSKTKFKFEQFGWVANINSPVFIASPIEPYIPSTDEFVVGHVPDTNYPVVLNKNIAITHHTAILGVTGTGKSVFARNLIKEFLKSSNTKVICIDFTKEYRTKFSALHPISIVPPSEDTKIFASIEWLINEQEKFGNQQDKNKIKSETQNIESIFNKSISDFLKSNNNLSIFEHPELSNTIGVLDYIRYFFNELFKIAKNNQCFSNKICVVLEEAHTVIPEWNFIGISDKISSNLVNKIGQIALQGRKYDIGFLVIAQRTANVSKTVLTQCNSVIAFQEFDRTSSEFLSNYFGENISTTLPNLKFRQAIAAGKAFKSNVPMIFEVPLINEE
jgi:hypothetical protein